MTDALAALRARVGTELGRSRRVEVGQARIATFADATDDHQWIHVDAGCVTVEREGGTKPVCVAEFLVRRYG